ncbi:MAG TPA: hypothetical protein VF064_08300 [Pyrinomonadaceae bacterium]
MGRRMFDGLHGGGTRVSVLLKGAALSVLAIHFTLALVSGYRAYYQVWGLELHLPGRVLRDGSTVRTSVLTSGRTFVDVRLEMLQDGHTELLAARQVPRNDFAVYDPRPQRAALTAALTPEVLARFRAGPALVRATAIGRPQWLRVPPPEVREFAVEVGHEPADAQGRR